MTADQPEGARTARLSPATMCGLVLALIVPLLPMMLHADYRGVIASPAQVARGLAIHWTNLIALLALVLLWESRRLASIGIRPFRWTTVIIGLSAGTAITVLSGVLVNALHLKADAQFAQSLMSLSLGLRVL